MSTPAAAVVAATPVNGAEHKPVAAANTSTTTIDNTKFPQRLIAPMHSVCGGPLHPYVSLKNSMVDAVSMMHMLHAVGRCTWEAGWLPPGVERSDKFSVFMASQMLVLSNPFSHHRHGIRRLPASANFTGQCGVLACPGGSSFSVFLETAIPLDKVHSAMGFGMCTIVRIDLSTRRPAKLPEEAKNLLQAQAAASGASARVNELGVTPLGRLPPAESIISTTVAPDGGAVSNNGGIRKFTFDISLRPNSDFDFNGHVNQGVYLTWIQDAVAAWRYDVRAEMAALGRKEKPDGADAAVAPPAVVNDDGHDHGDANEHIHVELRAFRLDYLGEIAQRQGTVRLSLYFDEASLLAAPSADADATPSTTTTAGTIRSHAMAAFGEGVITRMEDSAGDFYATPPSHEEVPASCEGDGSGTADTALGVADKVGVEAASAKDKVVVLSRARRVVPFYFEIAPTHAATKGPSSRGFVLADCFY